MLGAGAAGMTAAFVAAVKGLRVLLLESTEQVGGTSSRSAGTLWIPGNFSMTDEEARADIEQARIYLDAVVGEESLPLMRAQFLRHAAQMVAFLQQHSQVQFQACPRHTDYWPQISGARAGGRPVEARVFDGRELGAAFDLLRPTTPEFMVFGGMMVSKADVDKLLKVRQSAANLRHATSLVMRYMTDRLSGYSRGTRLTMGNALCGRLLKSVIDVGVVVRVSCEVTRIESVSSTEHKLAIDSPTGTEVVRALAGVVFAGGGFSANADWRHRLMPAPTPDNTAGSPGVQASTMEMALHLGGTLGAGSEHNAWWFPSSVVCRDDRSTGVFPHIVLDRAKPGLIAVDRRGRRFVNEGINYHQFCVAQYRHDAVPCWFICDARFLRRYGMGAVRPGGRSTKDWIRRGYLKSAATLDQLAVDLGINGDGLKECIGRMNDYAKSGKDLEFGKGDDGVSRQNGDPSHGPNPCLGPIAVPPFYAVEVAPADLGTSLGLMVNEFGQLLNEHGVAIQGLYACGNDMHSIMGGRYPAPGVTLGPGMTFAYLAALHIARQTAM